MKERVNHVDYYNTYKGFEVIDIVRQLDFDRGNAIKYILRAGIKKEEGLTDNQKAVEDIKKAIWYLNDYLEHVCQ